MARRVTLIVVVIIVGVVGIAAAHFYPSLTEPKCVAASRAVTPGASSASDPSEAPFSSLQQSSDQLVPLRTGSTGNATAITTTTATLHGSVTPHGENTHSYFQYGTSARYGTKTMPVDVGSVNRAVASAAEIVGLAPSMAYHYQVIIETPTHLLYGADECFVTSGSRQSSGRSTWERNSHLAPLRYGES